MNAFHRLVCRLLIASMAALPFQAGAGLLGTDAAVSAAVARERVAGLVSRDDVAGQLASLGVSREEARVRVAALSDAELASIAGQIDRLPAAADGTGVGILLIALFLLWRFVFSDQAKAEAEAAKKAEQKK